MTLFTMYLDPNDTEMRYLKSVENKFEFGGLILGPLWVAYKKGPLLLVLMLLAVALSPLFLFGINAYTIIWALLIWGMNSKSHSGLQAMRLKAMGYRRVGDVAAASRDEAETKFKKDRMANGVESAGQELADLLHANLGQSFPVSTGDGNKDNPLVVTEPLDYVSVEYAVVKHVLGNAGEEYKLSKQALLDVDGRKIDELVFNVKPAGADAWTGERRFCFDITVGFNRLGQ